MRGILVDWLVDIAKEYKLLPDTLYLSISYIDRFLSLNVFNRQKLQLLALLLVLRHLMLLTLESSKERNLRGDLHSVESYAHSVLALGKNVKER
ncbi:hypothetical protein I3760_10G071800 [Carya illinoinensis]|nr:hypothetical protein I3760_10G071800 [Carya illinoinensis]